MSDFTKVNLLELDDFVAGRAEGIEGRFGRSPLETRDVGVSHWRYSAGFKAGQGHKHGKQEEVYVVVAGSGQILLGDELVELGPWDAVRVAPETIRAFTAGPDGLEVIAVGGPRPEEGDGEMVEITWPDDDDSDG
jgi:mannose-6-phosphate isomerase-like protein (cupin superfamily)